MSKVETKFNEFPITPEEFDQDSLAGTNDLSPEATGTGPEENHSPQENDRDLNEETTNSIGKSGFGSFDHLTKNDRVYIPYIKLERLYGSDPEVSRAIYRIKKDSQRKPIYNQDDSTGDYLRRAGHYSILSKTDVEDLYAHLELGVATINQIEKVSDISPEDRVILIKATIAHKTMIESNLKLVISIAGRYNKFPDLLPLSDLISEGNFGLMRAITKFDVRKGFRFSTYATWWIKQSMLRAIAQKSRVIGIPVNINDDVRELNTLINDLKDDLKREPTLSEIMSVSEFSKEEINLLLTRGNHYIDSLDAPLEYAETKTRMDLVGSDRTNPGLEAISQIIANKDQVERIVNNPKLKLTDRQKVIIYMRNGLSLETYRGTVFLKHDGSEISCEQIEALRPASGSFTLEQVGQVFGYTRERIRQFEKEIMFRLKRSVNQSSY